ncbi:DNA-binding NarL/FixJ family response regulator [Mucilaginibacter yixingensis]|uniref:DNA-binding NarL/FixJ family response regulator n=1 Tax=Mucilaginibacter yixingensis TaxID=1295612 RepID=A0A2T5J4I2_9SPHI|nr:response regulator [Mucilaginibacter yixingensis]PTQ92413.1 DNA-binding NarL/FixJ family response regulator [Mucilaginibacter yixingensis]
MFKRVLITEDHESANLSLQKTMKDLGIPHVQYVYYCDDALLQLKNALLAGDAYDLLVTDLSFEEDDRPQTIKSGTGLVEAARKLQPDLKVLVFSAEHREAIIAGLFNEFAVNAYVRKARRDAQELKIAIEHIFKNKQYFPAAYRQVIRQNNAHDFTPYDVTIITQLSGGMLQKDIPAYLQEKQIRPSGLSSIEKRLSQIKEALGFTKNEQLVAYCKDKGII